MEKYLSTPVLLVVFNRPDTTRRVFEAVRQARPAELYIAADGPRPEKSGEKEKCAEVRQIVSQVDWPCEVFTDFAETNLGCGRRSLSAFDWVFSREETAIILEDDCLPAPDFFIYCEEMLTRYASEPKVMMVSGINVAGHWKDDFQDYHFSVYGGIWGWATWRRAWQKHDEKQKLWQNKEVRKKIREFIGDRRQFIARLVLLKNKGVFSWDYSWSLARLANQGLSIVPAKNLVTNIGYGDNATHTKTTGPIAKNLAKTGGLTFPLRENPKLEPDRDYDKYFFLLLHPDYRFPQPLRFVIKIINRFKRLFRHQ